MGSTEIQRGIQKWPFLIEGWKFDHFDLMVAVPFYIPQGQYQPRIRDCHDCHPSESVKKTVLSSAFEQGSLQAFQRLQL
jgi:hypothetical protein